MHHHHFASDQSLLLKGQGQSQGLSPSSPAVSPHHQPSSGGVTPATMCVGPQSRLWCHNE
jgi:hypothetical protein